jgi:alcohol dehydrogenase
MYVDGVTLRTGITNSRALIPQVLELLASKRLDPTPVATLVAAWDDAPRAFLERTTKVIVARPAREAGHSRFKPLQTPSALKNAS